MFLPPPSGTNPQIVFLCGARDYHAMDWYRSSLQAQVTPTPIIVTDLIKGEGFPLLLTKEDIVYKLFVLDSLLFRNQYRISNIWRNFLKIFFFPLQILLLRRFAAKHPNSLYYAHSMYYLWLAWASRLMYVGTPQGSDILIKPYNSTLYKLFSKWSMRGALLVTVDSSKMAKYVYAISKVSPLILQNGINCTKISKLKRSLSVEPNQKSCKILSFRGFTPLYRIDHIVRSRNNSQELADIGLDFVFPFSDQSYLAKTSYSLTSLDSLLGRVSRSQMYNLFIRSLLCVSVPSSDSSPRSVYEAIFCGAIVAVSREEYLQDLPKCMVDRIVVVDIGKPDWLAHAIIEGSKLATADFFPCADALQRFDQLHSFKFLYGLTLKLLNGKV